MAVVTEVLARISADPSRFVSGMKQAERAANSFGSSVAGSPIEATNRLGGAMKMMAGVATAAYAAASGAVMKFGTQAIQASAAYEQQVISFEGIFKGVGRSADDAKNYLSSLRDFAAKTPFEMPQLLDATKRLISLGYAAEDVRDRVMPAVGDIVAALGAPPDAINSVVYAFGQMKSAGRVMSQDLMQIGSALPGFNAKMAIAEQMFGGNIDAMNKAIESGTLTSEKAIEAMLGAMQKFPGAAGAMERQSKSLNGVMSTFKDNTRNALIDGLMPAIPLISNALSELEPAVTGLAKSFSMALGPAIADIVNNVGPALTSFLEQAGPIVSNLLSSVGGLLVAVLPPLASVLSMVTEVAASLFTQLGPSFQALVPAITTLAEALGSGLVTVIQALAPYLPELALSLAELVIALTPLIPLLTQALVLFTPLIPVLTGLVRVTAFLAPAIMTVVAAMVAWRVATAVYNTISLIAIARTKGLAVAQRYAAVSGKANAISTAILTAAQKAAAVGTWLWQAAQWALNIAMNMNPIGWVIMLIAALVGIVILIAKKTDWLGRIFSAVWNGIKKGAEAVWNWLKNNWQTLLAILTGPIGLAVKFIIDHWHEILDFFKGLPEKFKSFATSMMQGLLNGIKKIGGAIWNAITGVVTKPIDWVKKKLGIHSPSKVTTEMGKNIGVGLANGIDLCRPKTYDAAKDLKDAALGGMKLDSQDRRMLAQQAQAATKAYQDYRAGERGDPVAAAAGSGTTKKDDKKNTPGELTGLAKMRDDLMKTVKLNAALATLAGKNVPMSIIEDLRGKGEEGLKIAKEVLKKGSAAIKSLVELWNEANNPKISTADKISAFYEQQRQKLVQVLEDLRKAREDFRNEIKGMIHDQGLLGNLGLPTSYAAGADQLSYAMDSRVNAVKEFLDKMTALSSYVGKGKPLSGDLYRQILAMGPGAGTAMAEAFLNAGPDVMNAYRAGQTSLDTMGEQLSRLGAATYNADIKNATKAASAASAAGSMSNVTNNVTLEVKGSVVTDKELTKLVRDELAQLLRRKGVSLTGLGL